MTISKLKDTFRENEIDIFSTDEYIFLLIQLEKILVVSYRSGFMQTSDIIPLLKIYLKTDNKKEYYRNIEFKAKLKIVATILGIEINKRRFGNI